MSNTNYDPKNYSTTTGTLDGIYIVDDNDPIILRREQDFREAQTKSTAEKKASGHAATEKGLKRDGAGYKVIDEYPANTPTLDILKGNWERLRYNAMYQVACEYSATDIVEIFNSYHSQAWINVNQVYARVTAAVKYVAEDQGRTIEEVREELEEARRENGVEGKGGKRG